jgi:hypothetical protein
VDHPLVNVLSADIQSHIPVEHHALV